MPSRLNFKTLVLKCFTEHHSEGIARTYIGWGKINSNLHVKFSGGVTIFGC